MAKPNVKELVVNHFEKALFAVICLIVVISLAGTRWVPYGGHPTDITKKVTEADRKIAAKTWPAEEQEQFVVPKNESVEELVAKNVHVKVNPTPYEFDVPFFRDLYGVTKPIVEPEYLGIQALLADGGRVLIGKMPEKPLDESEGDDKLMADASTEEADDQENIPEQFRSRENLKPAPGAGGLGSQFGYDEEYAAANEDMAAQYESYGYGDGQYGDYGGEGMGMAMGPTVEGRGLRYVAVRGIIPLREQVRKLMKAINLRSFAQASNLYEIIDFELERKKMQPGDEPWGGEWDPVDVQVAIDILNEALSFDPEVVQGTLTDAAVTMPLPGRLMGIWQSMATHPMLEDFTLSPEEIEKEFEFNQMLLSQYEEQQKSAPEERVKKRGFTEITYDTRSMGMSAFNMDYEGAMTQDYDYSEDYGAYGGAMGMGMGSGMGMIDYAPTTQGQMTAEAKEFVDKLTKGELGRSKEEKDKALLEYIQERVTAQGELLLFRYFDFDVEPGATYKYRARLEVRNPNFGLPIAQVGGYAQIVEGQTRKTDWSNETEPATVPYDVDYFVAKIDENGAGLAEARMAVFQWNPEYGTTIFDNLEVTYGEEIGGPKKTFILDPAKNRFEAEQYMFHTGDVLVDALPGDKIPGNELREGGLHADLQLPRSARGELGISGQVLISQGDEQLAVIDQRSRIPAFQKRREYLGFEQKPYEDIKNKENQKPDVSDLEAYGGEYGAAMMDMMSGDGDYGAYGGSYGESGGAEDYGRGRRQGSGLRKRPGVRR